MPLIASTKFCNLILEAFVSAKRFFQSLAAVLLALSLSTQAFCSAQTDEAAVRLAIVNTYGRSLMLSYFSETMRAIRREISPRKLVVDWHSPQSFLEAASSGSFDIAIASSGLSHVMADRNAGTLLLSSVRDVAPDPLRANGAVIVVRSDRSDINSLSDLKGKTLAIMSKTAFAGWQVPAAELIRHGIDVRHFFKQIVTAGAPMTNVLELVRDQRADAGFLATCMLEDLDAIGLIDKNDYKVLNARPESIRSLFGCTASTELFASWTFSVMPSLSNTLAEQIARALLRLEAKGLSSRWTVNLDRSGPKSVFQQLNLPYQETYDLRAFLYEQRRWVFAALSVFALVLANIVVLMFALRVRTRQKEKAIEEKYQAQWMAQQYQLKLEALEKSRLVGTLSSLAAHELKQPLAVINNYAGTIRRKMQKSALPHDMLLKAVSEIEASGLKAAEIVDHVRLYASGRHAEYERVDLAKVLQKVAASRRNDAACIKMHVPQSVFVMGDAMELELMVLNLVKNACATVQKCPDPQVNVALAYDRNFATIAVTDNGPVLSQAEFERIGKDFYTTKSDGLGLGIQLVRSMAETHGGALILERSDSGGLRAVIRLPLADTETENK